MNQDPKTDLDVDFIIAKIIKGPVKGRRGEFKQNLEQLHEGIVNYLAAFLMIEAISAAALSTESFKTTWA